MKKLIFLPFLLAFLNHGFSQNTSCGNEVITGLQKANLKNYDEHINTLNKTLKKYIGDHYAPANPNVASRPNPTIYYIPVVFHVVYPAGQAYGTGANISYAQLQSQIDALNAAFGKNYPAYNGQTHPAYAQNTNIRFCLARLAQPSTVNFYNGPNGTEYGVMRYANTALSNHQMTNASATSLLGLTHPSLAYFPFANYLNVWVVTSINGGSPGGITMGYAPLPLMGSYPLDGVVMRSDVIGDNSTGNNYSLGYGLQQGKVLCHEVGHYMNLLHIFQGGCAGANAAGSATDACDLNGDCICDIEPCTTQNISCSQPIPNTCSANYATGTTTLDMIGSYMSYADDNCMNTFTMDQAQRMWATLNTQRAGLWQIANLGQTGVAGPNGCNPPTLFVNINNPSNNCVGSILNLVNPMAGNTANSWTWTATGSSVPSANTYSVALSYATPGLHTIKLAVSDGTLTVADSIVISVVNCSLDPNKLNRSNWLFGDYASVSFATGQAVANNVALANNTIKCFENAVSMSDSLGNLLFYSNGRDLWNSSHVLVNPGAPLFGWDLLIPSPGGYSGTSVSGFMSFPAPKKPGKYFIVCVPPYETKGQPTIGQYAKISYVIYDAVSQTVTPFQSLVNGAINYTSGYPNFGLSENLSVVPHCNGVDYWLIARGTNVAGNASNFYSFLVNANGLSPSGAPVVSGPFTFTLATSVSDLKSNSSGTKLVCKAKNKTVGFIWDFNPATGQVSNPVALPTSATAASSMGVSGIIFSPNDQYIYSSAPTGIDMIDVASNTLVKTIVPTNGYVDDNSYFEIGPDNNIYMWGTSNASGFALAKLTNPNSVPNSTVNSYVSFAAVPGSDPFFSLLNFMEAVKPPESSPILNPVAVSCSSYSFSLNPCWKIYNTNWNFGDGAISTASNVVHAYVSPGTYTVTLTLSYNGQNLPAVTRTISVVSPASVNITGPSAICLGSPYLNSYGVTQIPNASYTWSASNASITGPPTLANITASGGTVGIAILTVQVNNGGCIISTTKTINIVNLQVNLVATPSVACQSQNVTLAGSPAGGTYSGTTSGNIFNSTATGTYNLSYTYTDANGCYNTAGASVKIYNCTGIYENSPQDWAITLYPNPNNGMLYINSSRPIYNYEITDMLGQLVQQDMYGTGISTVTLSKGVYFISFKNEAGEKAKLKFMKE